MDNHAGKSPTAIWARSCKFCEQPIPFLDFGEGRAVIVSGIACCASCADEGAWIRTATVLPEGVAQRRTTARFLPSVQLKLDLRFYGLKGFFAGNVVKRWLDVSEGGLRVVVKRRCSPEERLKARISHPLRKHVYSVVVVVRHVQNSDKFKGATVAGMQFEKPPADLVECIRRVHSSDFLLPPEEKK
jgi:hypothetical protein